MFNYFDRIQIIDNCCLSILSPKSDDLNKVLQLTNIENQDLRISIIAFDEGITDLTKISRYINSIEEKIFNLDVNNILKFYIEKDELLTEENLWEKRALLYKDFLLLSKEIQEKEYHEVLDWYHNQYEILPLWYKRLGHIIKVIMGKRTFRSLFNDNVKKYKD